MSHYSQECSGVSEGTSISEPILDAKRTKQIDTLSHLLNGELGDLAKPPDARRSPDVYHGPDETVNHTLLADAPRAKYWISGVEYSRAKLDAVDEIVENLVRAVRECLEAVECRTRERATLMRFVTMLLSQAGFALLETACDTRLALSGGKRNVIYELDRAGEGAWTLRAHFFANGFLEYFDARAGSSSSPQQCSPSSFLRRGYEIQIRLDERSADGISVELLDLTDCVNIFDKSGHLTDLETSRDEADEALEADPSVGSMLSWWASVPSSILGDAGDVEQMDAPLSSWASIPTSILGDGGMTQADVPLDGHQPNSSWLAAWEGQTLRLGPSLRAEDILEAWYGSPLNESLRTNVTDDIRALVSSLDADGNGSSEEVNVSVNNNHWGDPAFLVFKKLYVHVRSIQQGL